MVDNPGCKMGSSGDLCNMLTPGPHLRFCLNLCRLSHERLDLETVSPTPFSGKSSATQTEQPASPSHSALFKFDFFFIPSSCSFFDPSDFLLHLLQALPLPRRLHATMSQGPVDTSTYVIQDQQFLYRMLVWTHPA